MGYKTLSLLVKCWNMYASVLTNAEITPQIRVLISEIKETANMIDTEAQLGTNYPENPDIFLDITEIIELSQKIEVI